MVPLTVTHWSEKWSHTPEILFWKLDIDSPLILKNLLDFGVRESPVKFDMWFSKHKRPELLVNILQ